MVHTTMVGLPEPICHRSNVHIRPPGSRSSTVARPVSRVPLLALAVALMLAPASQAAKTKPCKRQPSFACATVTVPLDRAGRVPGTIAIRYAVQRRVPVTRPVLVALSGGPGQSSVSAAESFALSLEPALKRYRLAVLDQRISDAQEDEIAAKTDSDRHKAAQMVDDLKLVRAAF